MKKNPAITGVLATDAHELIKAYGSQAAGWAKDFAFACKEKTKRAYWMKVYNRILNTKTNPAQHYPVMSYAKAHAWEKEAARRGVSQVARSSRGFMRAYQRAGSWGNLPEKWKRKRNAFVARHMAQGKTEKLWKNGKPSRRALALIMWAYMPPRYERNPKIHVLSDFYKSQVLAKLLSKKEKKEYIVVNAHAVLKYPMLDSEEMDTFEVMTAADFKKIDKRKRGYIAYTTKKK